jgi:phosphate:Na+ symporter
MVSGLLGGIGLFLLGMILMTDGLKSLAGDALRRVLARFVRGPWSGLASGAGVTTLVQSSSATTLTTIGFVSAGLLSFPQAVAVLLGANLGTTSTGWIVSLLGLKLSMVALAYPLIGIGALLRLLARERVAAAGLALAGFGLIFVGIDTLQGAMAHLAERLDPADMPDEGLAGRLALVWLGALMTVVVQSSSAAVATTLTALHGGAITLPAAAALVIGQNVGTTVTAGLAAIGASTAARRTALAHVLFNVFTGVVALLVLPQFVRVAAAVAEGSGEASGAVALATFHTAFNLLGVLLVLPVLGPFARLIERLVPERGPALTRRLDPSVAHLPQVAVEAARLTLREIGARLAERLSATLAPSGRSSGALAATATLADALWSTRHFLGRIRSAQETATEHRRHVATLHALDHLDRLTATLAEARPARVLADDPAVARSAALLSAELPPAQVWLRQGDDQAPREALAVVAAALAERHRLRRIELLEETASGALSPDDALTRLEALRWLEQLAHHLWRAVHHLDEPGAADPVVPSTEASRSAPGS